MSTIETKKEQELCKFDKSIEMFERAAKVIPCGIYGHLTPAIRTPGATPYYTAKAKGAHYWDVDGNEFIDWMCAYGPMVVGYNNPRVEEAAAKQRELGNCTNHPSEVMIDLAEKIVDLIPFADWSVFAKNGSDLTTWATQVARAHTGRVKIAMVTGTYHGTDAWCTPGHAGITKADRSDMLYFGWNDMEGLRKLVKQHKGEIAGVIMTPYHFPNWSDNMLPTDGFWRDVQNVCREEGIVLILDDVRSGFRVSLHGSQEYFGFEPDLGVYCKAIGNGYPISAAAGRDDLKKAAAKVFLTGSYWFSCVPMAASLATIKEIEETDGIKTMRDIGAALAEGMEKLAAAHGLQFKCTGHPSMFYIRFTNDDDLFRNQLFCAEMCKRGIFAHPHHNWFISTAHTMEDVNKTLEAADTSFKIVKKHFGS